MCSSDLGRLYVAHPPGLGPQDTEQRFRVGRAGTDFEVERLLQEAAVRRPECRQLENEILEGHAVCVVSRGGAGHE